MASKSASPRLLITRPQHAAERFLDELNARGLPVAGAVISPAVRIQPVGDMISAHGSVVTIFTSASAVQRAEPLRGATAFCVGERTAEVARQKGFVVDLVEDTAKALISSILEASPTLPLVHLRGVHTREDLATSLRIGGLEFSEKIVYDQQAQEPIAEAQTLLTSAHPIVLPLFSPRTAELVRSWLPAPYPTLHCAALSPAVFDAWGLPAEISRRPNLSAMLDTVSEIYSTLGKG